MVQGGDQDFLTGLCSTGAFQAALDARASGPAYTVGLVDILGLGLINQQLGGEAGDELLRQVGRRLSTAGSASLVARVGGDRFALLRDGAERDGQWLRALQSTLLRRPFALNGGDVVAEFAVVRGIGPPPSGRNILWLLERELYVEKTRVLHQRIAALGKLLDSAPQLIAEFMTLRTELERYRGLAKHDPATGLLNHIGLEERLAGLGSPFAIAFIDLDDLREINKHGDLWEEGNKAIQGVANRLRRAFGTENVARWGGDEDVVVAPGLSAAAMATRLHRVLEECRAELVLSGRPVTFSAGVSECGDHDVDAARMRAERATGRAKGRKASIEIGSAG